MNTVKHRERRSAAPARRATETYSCSTSRERNAAGVDAAALECQRIYGAGYYISRFKLNNGQFPQSVHSIRSSPWSL
ncbi:MAG: hypothetical protein KKF66_04345, partial [Actinobacteria bacterium]|nr:hypothetical protein [Actinomycetota bacterium]